MKYYLIAGEASGDLHGSNLLKELAAADEKAEFRYFGGDLMQTMGGELVKHYREMAFMGFINVILNLKTINKNLQFCKNDILKFNPDVLILIDYPGFNLRIAEFAKQNNIRVFYYISPKIWAWKEYRVKKIKAFVDEMFTIFPFETGFYKKHEMEVNYVGNPLLDAISVHQENTVSKEEFLQKNNLNEKPIIAILAGSRVQEIKKMLPVMLDSVQNYTDFQWVISGVKTVPETLYSEIIQKRNIPVLYHQTYNLLTHAHSALVTSGTATLETALFKIPQVVLYKAEGGWFLDILFRQFLLKTKYVSLPNIIVGEEIIRELLQMQMTLKNVKIELDRLLKNQEYRKTMIANYNKMRDLMGEPGSSKRAALKMIEMLENSKN